MFMIFNVVDGRLTSLLMAKGIGCEQLVPDRSVVAVLGVAADAGPAGLLRP
jgi:hypothetical protein